MPYVHICTDFFKETTPSNININNTSVNLYVYNHCAQTVLFIEISDLTGWFSLSFPRFACRIYVTVYNFDMDVSEVVPKVTSLPSFQRA